MYNIHYTHAYKTRACKQGTHLNASMRFLIRSPPNTRNSGSSRDRKNLRVCQSQNAFAHTHTLHVLDLAHILIAHALMSLGKRKRGVKASWRPLPPITPNVRSALMQATCPSHHRGTEMKLHTCLVDPGSPCRYDPMETLTLKNGNRFPLFTHVHMAHRLHTHLLDPGSPCRPDHIASIFHMCVYGILIAHSQVSIVHLCAFGTLIALTLWTQGPLVALIT